MTDPATGPIATDSAAVASAPPITSVRVGRASAFLASGTIVSRVLGFLSAVVLAEALGLIGSGADTFSLANQLPNNVYSLVAGGLLSAIVVPQIVKAGLHDDGGQRFISRLMTLAIVAFLGLTLVAVVCAPLLVRLYASSGDRGFTPVELALATSFAYWCLPQIFFYALYSLVGETLNARGIFGPFTWTPAINNVVAIGGITAFIAIFGGDPAHRAAATWTVPQVALLAGSATVGIAAQAIALFFFWRRTGLTFRPDFRWRGVGLGSAGRSAAWVFGMFLVTQVSGVVESQVATEASGEFASLAVLKYAWLMFMLPHSIATVSIVTAYFTRMSTHARDRAFALFRGDLTAALTTILMIMVFSTVGLAVLSYPFSAVFPRSDYQQVGALANVYLAFLTGLIPFTVFFVLLRVYYAIEDTRTPFVIQVIQTACYVVGALAVGVTVAPEWIAVGLALVLSAAVTIQAILSAVFLRSRIGGLGFWPVTRQALWFGAAALVAGGVGTLLLAALGGVGQGAYPVSDRVGGIASMVLVGGAMALVYAGILWVTRNPPFLAALEPLARRLRRGTE